MLNLIERKIRRAFSNAAVQYDILTGMQKEIGRELIARVEDRKDCALILDVGMGTGWLTGRLSAQFPGSKVVGMDFAEGMVRRARQGHEGFQVIQGDAQRLPFRPDAFDLVVSNLAYQWVQDLPAGFTSAFDRLRPGGVFVLTMFGHATFRELFESLAQAHNGKASTAVIRRLAREQDIRQALARAGFRDVRLEKETISAHFPSMMDLVKWIKDIGANTLPRNFYIGRELFLRTNDHYEQQFRDHLGVKVTFEVFWVSGVK